MELVLSMVRYQKVSWTKKATTETEIVAVSEYMPHKIHMINISLGQSYAMH